MNGTMGADDEAKVERNSKIGLGMMFGGGVVAATGIALIILNRPRPYATERQPAAAQLVPSLTPAGVALVGRF